MCVVREDHVRVASARLEGTRLTQPDRGSATSEFWGLGEARGTRLGLLDCCPTAGWPRCPGVELRRSWVRFLLPPLLGSPSRPPVPQAAPKAP